MATAADPNTPSPPQESVQSLTTTAIATFVGLTWGAVMLFVFGFWMRSKYTGSQDGQIVTNIFLVAGVAAAGLAIWQAFTLWIQKLTPEAKAAALENQRRIFSYILLAGGIGLILLAFALGFEKKSGNYVFSKDNFAETFGSLLLGLITLGCGYYLQQPLTAFASPIQALVGRLQGFKLAFAIVWILAAIGLVILYTRNQSDFTSVLPEMFGLLFFMILLIACLIWLNTGEFDEVGVRKFILVLGGATGIIIFLATLWRAYLWRQDIFLGGAAAWQGPNAWHFWLCAYVLFGSLVLMFFSFNVARADIRKDVALRRIMYGYDTIVQGLLLVGILAIFNIVIYAMVPFSFDWTKNRGAYALSDSSKNLLAGLKDEAHLLVLIPQNSPVNSNVRNLLDNCQAIASRDRLKVRYVSPDVSQVDFAALVSVFPQILPDPNIPGAGRGILIVYGPMPKEAGHTTPHVFIAERKLFDSDRPMRPGDKAKFTFKGEGEIMRELKFLTEGRKKRKIYILQGNEEVDMSDNEIDIRQDFRTPFAKMGVGLLVDRLVADNYEVLGLSFNPPAGNKNPKIEFAKEGPDKKKSIPPDCHTLIVAGVSKALPDEALKAIERYLDHGNGKMLVFVDVVADDTYSKVLNSGIEGLLKDYGVEVTNEFLIRIPDRQLPDPRALLGTPPRRSENPLAREFLGRGLLIRQSARVIRPAEGRFGFKGETILQVPAPSDQSLLVQKDAKVLNITEMVRTIKDLQDDDRKRGEVGAREPASVAVAVADKDGKPRMVVFGDTEFITNLDISRGQRINYALTVSALDWMAERETIGTQPDERSTVALDPTVSADFWRIILVPLWLMMLTCIGLGVAFWLVRRR